MEYKEQTNAKPCYISDIANFKNNGSIYPPYAATVIPEIFFIAKPHAMKPIENPDSKSCPRNYSGYSKIGQMCGGDSCVQEPLVKQKRIIPFNNVNYYNCKH